jgi:hypothetical protein
MSGAVEKLSNRQRPAMKIRPKEGGFQSVPRVRGVAEPRTFDQEALLLAPRFSQVVIQTRERRSADALDVRSVLHLPTD